METSKPIPMPLFFAFDVTWETTTEKLVDGRHEAWIATMPVVGGIVALIDWPEGVQGAN